MKALTLIFTLFPILTAAQWHEVRTVTEKGDSITLSLHLTDDLGKPVLWVAFEGDTAKTFPEVHGDPETAGAVRVDLAIYRHVHAWDSAYVDRVKFLWCDGCGEVRKSFELSR